MSDHSFLEWRGIARNPPGRRAGNTGAGRAVLEIVARVVLFHVEDPERENAGGLHFCGGLEVTSDDARFGGLSALQVSEDGARLTAFTDRGQ